MQSRVLGPGFFQNRNISIGVFPIREEILVGSPTFRGVAGNCISARKAEARERTYWRVLNYAKVIDNFLKLSGGGGTLMRR
jgi:hypothetical protein